MKRFTDPVQTSTLLLKLLDAQRALLVAQHQPDYALACHDLENGCRVMVKLENFEVICTMLDALIKKFKPPEIVETKKKRKNAASAATPVLGSVSVFGLTREQASLPTVPQSVAASGTSAASLGDEIEPNSRIGETSSVLRAMPFPAANINRMSQLDANSSGLSQARSKKRTTSDVQTRSQQLLAHIKEIASDGKPLWIKALNESFRKATGMSAEDLPSAKLKLALKHICNHENEIEYLILQQQDQEIQQSFIPATARQNAQPQTLIGTAPIGEMMLCYYKNWTKRKYGGKRKSNENAPDSEQNCEQVCGGDSETHFEPRYGGDEHVGQFSSGIFSWGQPCFNPNDGAILSPEIRLLSEIRSNENSNDSTDWFGRPAPADNVAGTESCSAWERPAAADMMQISSLIEGQVGGDGNNGGGNGGDGGGGGGGDDGGDGGSDAGDGQDCSFGERFAELAQAAANAQSSQPSGSENCGVERFFELVQIAADAQSSQPSGSENAENSTGVRGRWVGRGAAAASGVRHRPQGLSPPESENDTRAGASKCGCCGSEPGLEFRVCPKCSSPICQTCASITIGLARAVRPFLNNLQCAAWVKLHCLSCQTLEDFDRYLFECLDDVSKAITVSLTRKTIDEKYTTLWYHVGLLFAVGGPFSGVIFSDEFRQCVEKMLRHEVKAKNIQSSIAPWEAESLGFPPDLILSIAKSYARRFKLSKSVTLDVTKDRQPIILYVSADLGDHPTAHLMSAELIEMRSSERAEVWLLCVANLDRLAALNSSSSPYREELKKVYGSRFLEHGHLEDKDITQKINELRPHVIYLAGFHQDGDRIAVFKGVTCAVIVQAVAHASTTGSTGVHRLLCNHEVLPEGMQKDFTERFLYIDGPFLPNSFKTFFRHDVEPLWQLRNNAEIRQKERETRKMPSTKIIANIARPDRLEQNFFDMAIQILKANADTVLVLIDHGYPAFRLRKEASFKEQGLEGKIVFMPFQGLQDGELHKFLALIDVYLDTVGYNGHTAGQDALWANGVLVTVRGTRLASRIGADLLTWFGTPENICEDAGAAVARVNELLQDPARLSEARAKAELCRSTSNMYDNAHRAKMVIDALLRAFEETARDQQMQSASSASASQQLEADDLPLLSNVMDGLGIELDGPSERNDRFWIFRAKFRYVPVEVKVTNDLDVLDEDNAAFREVLAREWKFSEFGLQLFSQLLPFVEDRVVEHYTELDVIQIPCREKKAYVVIEEAQAYRAGALLDGLAAEWRAPGPGTVLRTAWFLLGELKVLGALHARKMAYGGDPRDFKLSLLKDGFEKKAAAYVEHNGVLYSLLLGGAERLIHRLVPCTFSTQEHLNAPPQRLRTRTCSRRSKAVMQRSLNAASPPVRKSIRLIGSNASISAGDIKTKLSYGSDNLPDGPSIFEKAKRDDLRKAAMAVLNAILGRTGQETVVASKGQGACDLYRDWLVSLSQDELRNATGLPNLDHLEDVECKGLMKKILHLKDLMDMLALLLGDAQLDADGVLARGLFTGMAVPLNAHPEGLESAPEAVRNDLRACPPLMRQIAARVLHIYVEGRTLEWNKEQKRLIPTWLVFNWEADKKTFNRSLWTAAAGEEGNLGAIYQSPLVTHCAHTTWISKLHLLLFPTSTCRTVMDGRPRAFDDTLKAVAAGLVAQYVNSSQDEKGAHTRVCNCSREWNTDWSTLDRPAQPRADAAMGLKLTRRMHAYEELLYTYAWGKYSQWS